MRKQNCWELKKCGRELGGAKVREFGVCPAATETRAEGIHGGKNGGRACWAITGTLCRGETQGRFVDKAKGCLRCDFFELVQRDEGKDLRNVQEIQSKLSQQGPQAIIPTNPLCTGT